MDGTEERHPVMQGLMDKAYDRWQANDRLAREYTPNERAAFMSKQQFWDSLDERERFAVHLGNMNYQVCNGGWLQWSVAGNAYGTREVVDYNMAALLRVGTEPCRVVWALLKAFRAVRITDSMSDRQHERACAILDPLDSAFYAINERMLDELELYLARGAC